MRRWTRTAAVFVLSLTTTLTACGDDDDPAGPGGDGSQLTVVESQALVEVILGGALTGAGSSMSVAGTSYLMAGSPPIEFDMDEVMSCALAGSVRMKGRVTGTVDENTGASTMSMDLQLIHSACRAQASTGDVFTLNGAPNLAMRFDMETSETALAYDGSMTGSVAWTKGDKQGTCAIDMSYDATMDMNTGAVSGSSTGTACGHAVSETM